MQVGVVFAVDSLIRIKDDIFFMRVYSRNVSQDAS